MCQVIRVSNPDDVNLVRFIVAILPKTANKSDVNNGMLLCGADY